LNIRSSAAQPPAPYQRHHPVFSARLPPRRLLRSEIDNPGRVRVLETYRDADDYQAHIQTPHFKKFRATTDNIVKSRKLIDTVPISLAAKAK
jgi:hypothetical protein